MNINKTNPVFLVFISLLSSMVSIAIYDKYFIQSEGRMKYNQELALAVAEREIVLSDRFNQAYRSSYPTDFIQAAEMSRKAVVFIKYDSNIDRKSVV